MIIQELARYYEKLKKDGIGIPEMGYCSTGISFALVIDSHGNAIQIDDIRNNDSKKPFPQMMEVPYNGVRTSGIKPAFLWDKAEYVFGISPKDKSEIENKDDIAWKLDGKGRKKFDSFRECHSAIAEETEDEDLKSLARFLESWAPEKFSSLSGVSNDVVTGNIVFQILGRNQYLHDKPSMRNYWIEQQADRSAALATCLVSGQDDEVMKVHAGIKNIPGAQSSGAPLISFNKDSFCSYGKSKNDQGENAPIGKQTAFAYATVLNYLLARESRQKIRIADSTAVFWAERESRAEAFLGGLLEPPKGDGFSKEVQVYLESIRKGSMPKELDGKQRFYILGLSPNAARLSVRFWYVNTVEEISRRIVRHFEQLEIVRQSEKQHLYPGIWSLLVETACQHKSENIPPNLAGPLMMAILKGTPYPASLLSILIERLRVEKNPNYYKCALIKAILIRNYRKEVGMSLDKERTDLAYVTGRLFALLEKIQEESAGGKLNATIKDKYFASASTHPKMIFPLLIRLSQNHQKKLKSEKPGLAVNRQKEIQAIMGKIDSFPSYLKLEDQGLFAIGYYHQYQNFFIKRETETIETNDENQE